MSTKPFLLGFLLVAGLAPVRAQQSGQLGDLQYVSSSIHVVITRYVGPGGSVTIPARIIGLRVTSIGREAFKGCTGLTNITIPDSVAYIQSGAFSGCTGLSSVTIPNSVTTISDWAFERCTGLSNLVIGNSVTGIWLYAFSGCTGLTRIIIPESVTTIGNGAFSGCTGLTSITIPDSVRSIETDAFSGCIGLTSLVIGNNVNTIGWRAFSGCRNLTSLTIPHRVYSIEPEAFSGCTGLTGVVIGGNVQSIGTEAFSGCTALTSITIPNRVTSIGESAFRGCTSLTGITVGALNRDYSSQDGVLFNKSLTVLVQCPGGRTGSYIMPDTVTEIGHYSFSDCTGLTSITIPDSVRRIGNSVFEGCTGLTRVMIGSGVTEIGSWPFWGCSGLTSIEVAPRNLRYRSYEGVMFNTEGTTLIKCPNGRTGSYMIPESVTSIGEQAFYDCTGLTSITIPNSVSSIGYGAFDGCTGLRAIEVDTLNPAFSGLEGVLFNTSHTVLIACPGGKIGNYVIPDTVTKIAYSAFRRCTGLTSITIGNSVTSIEDGAFAGCTGLTSVMIPDSVSIIGWYAFKGCSKLSAAYFEGDCPLLGFMLFEDCSPTLWLYYRPGTRGWPWLVWYASAYGVGTPTAPWVAPRIQWQPDHVLFHASKPAAVDMGLSAIPPAACQWYLNAVPLEGATNASLRLPVVTAAHEAWYTLVATNPMGSVTSRPVAALVSNVDPHVLAVLTWPGDPVNPITLQASGSVTGPWTDRQDYPQAEGVQGYVEPDGTAAALFYRLKGARPVALAATGRINGWWFEEAAGSQHRIEYVSPSAGWAQWQVLTNLTLPSSPYLFVDHASQAEPGGAYRVTPVP